MGLDELKAGDQAIIKQFYSTRNKYIDVIVIRRTKTLIIVAVPGNKNNPDRHMKYKLDGTRANIGYYSSETLCVLDDQIKADMNHNKIVEEFFPVQKRLADKLHYPYRLSIEQLEKLTAVANELFPETT